MRVSPILRQSHDWNPGLDQALPKWPLLQEALCRFVGIWLCPGLASWQEGKLGSATADGVGGGMRGHWARFLAASTIYQGRSLSNRQELFYQKWTFSLADSFHFFALFSQSNYSITWLQSKSSNSNIWAYFPSITPFNGNSHPPPFPVKDQGSGLTQRQALSWGLRYSLASLLSWENSGSVTFSPLESFNLS